METLYAIPGTNCSVIKLGFAEWVGLEEPNFFNLIETDDPEHWLQLQAMPFLASYTNLVTVLRVGDKMYKMDGKSRIDLWSSGKCQKPTAILAWMVDITDTELTEFIQETHTKFKSSLQPNEVIKNTYKEHDLTFVSPRIKEGFLFDAINTALRGRPRPLQDKRLKQEKEEINLNKAISVLQNELKLIDELNPNPEVFVSGVIAACLVMLGIKKDLHVFLERLNNYHGESKDGMDDPVAGLLRALESYRVQHKDTFAYITVELFKKTINAIMRWEEGPESPKYWRRNTMPGIDPQPFIESMKRLKGIHGQPDL